MLGWTVTFLIIALIAAVLGFGGVAGVAATAAKILFVVFLIAFVVSLIAGRRVRMYLARSQVDTVSMTREKPYHYELRNDLSDAACRIEFPTGRLLRCAVPIPR